MVGEPVFVMMGPEKDLVRQRLSRHPGAGPLFDIGDLGWAACGYARGLDDTRLV